MTILSRYTLGRFCGSLALSLTAFVAISVVIHLVEHISAFLDRDIGLGVIVMFYVYYLPYIVIYVLPMAMLLAGLFCMGELIRNGELLAMKAMGKSLYQVVFPLHLFALGISVFAVLWADRVVPRATARRAQIEQPRRSLVGPRGVRRALVLRDEGGWVFSMREFAVDEMRGRGVVLDRFEDGLAERIRAEEVVWENEHWTFLNGERRIRTPNGDVFLPFVERRVSSITLLPEDFTRDYRPEQHLNYTELSAFIHRKERNGGQALRERVARHMRLAFPFSNFVIGLFGLPLASRMRRSGRPLQVGVCLFTCFAFYSCIQAGRVMGWNGIIDPVWGAWGANLLFALLGVILLVRTRK
ncbi:MAG: lipopolysaccharide export system permease protein [Candidatus Latescibacterota bacterium]